MGVNLAQAGQSGVQRRREASHLGQRLERARHGPGVGFALAHGDDRAAAARTRRRAAEGQADAVDARDRLDSTRKTAPLMCAAGAHRIDNTHQPLAAVVAEIVALVGAARR